MFIIGRVVELADVLGERHDDVETNREMGARALL